MENNGEMTEDELMTEMQRPETVKKTGERIEANPDAKPPEDDASSFDFGGDEYEEAEIPEAEIPESEKESIDFEDEHMDMAKMFLLLFDKSIGFILHLVAKDFDFKNNYRRYSKSQQPEEADLEAKALASLIKKYGIKLGAEFLFISAMTMAYAAPISMAMKDRKKNGKNNSKKKKAEDIEYEDIKD